MTRLQARLFRAEQMARRLSQDDCGSKATPFDPVAEFTHWCACTASKCSRLRTLSPDERDAISSLVVIELTRRGELNDNSDAG